MTNTARRKRCPICGRPADAELAPFCSKRCADVDLHRWLSGAYAIPAVDREDDAASRAARPPREDDET